MRLLSKRQVKELVLYCPQYIQRHENANRFPKRLRLSNGMLAAQVSNRHATFLLTQYPNNPFFVKSALLHRLLLKNGIRLYSFLDQFAGLRSVAILV